jgi:type II secretory ATPase GspE/PulE/Tfp pilus assembly ATPase PilB-like protein
MNMTGLALGALTGGGDYFSIVKLVLMLVLLWPWLYACTWIHRDAVKVHTVQALWTVCALAAGVLGLLLWLVVPIYAVGLLLYLACAGSAIAVYVLHRNKRVVAKAKVMTLDHLKGVFERRAEEKVEVVAHLKLYDSLGRPVFAPGEDQPQLRQAYNLTQELLHDVVMLRTSEVDLAPSGARAVVRFVVDGVLVQQPPIERTEAEVIIDFVKHAAGMNVEDRRKPQTGKIAIQMGAVNVDIAVTAAGTTAGQRMQLKVTQEAAKVNLDQLGLAKDLLAKVEEYNMQPSGLIIVAAARGNGLTSTLYSLLRRHDMYTQQIATLEIQPPVDLENVTQNKYKDQTELPGRLAAALRRDPDVVMVDECGVAQTAELICQAAKTKNVLLGCVADSSFKALAMWVKTAGDPAKALAPLKAVLCQQLLRKLCPSCREAYHPAKDLLARLNLPAEKIDKFYRPPTKPAVDERGQPQVCPTCRGSHYFGRTAAFELLELTDEIRQLIASGAPLDQIRAASRKNRMLYLQEQALRKVIDGTTSIEEVVRVSKAK